MHISQKIGINAAASLAYSIIRSRGVMLIAPLGGIIADKVFKSTSTLYIVLFVISGVMFIILLIPGIDLNLNSCYKIKMRTRNIERAAGKEPR